MGTLQNHVTKKWTSLKGVDAQKGRFSVSDKAGGSVVVDPTKCDRIKTIGPKDLEQTVKLCYLKFSPNSNLCFCPPMRKSKLCLDHLHGTTSVVDINRKKEKE